MSLVRLNRLLSRLTPVRSVRLDGGRPVASITFDDFPKSAWSRGGPILARHNVRATYYTAGSFCGRTVDGTAYYDSDDLRAQDAARNAEFLRPFLKGGTAESYAFPYGLASPRTKKFYAHRFTNVRGVHPGLNAGRADLALLNAMSMEKRCWNREAIARVITRARNDRAWIIFYTHDVGDDPSPYGSTPGMLSEVLERLAEARIEILPMREAVKAA